MITNWNKKGASLSGWAEGAIGIMVIVICLGVIIVGMNLQYHQSNDPTFGLSSDKTKADFEAYQNQLDAGLSGDASTNSITGGINLLSSWGMAKQGFNIIRDFVSGVWITNGVGLLGSGTAITALGWGLRLLFIFSLIFILITLIFKVRP